MQQGQFGRRGVVLNDGPIEAARPMARGARPAPARPAHVNSDGTFNGWRWVVMALVGTLVVLAWIEALFSGTALLTPIDGSVLWTMRGIGGAVGLVVALLLFAKIARENSLAKAILTALVLPLMFAVLFNGIAWRAADWASFGFSQQPFEAARYQIDSISPGRKGRRDVISIDPFDTGEDTEIPVSDAQYNQLVETSASSCVTVMQRRAPSGAIEILTDGEYTLSEPAPVEVGPCVLGSTAQSTSGANPWSKQ